MINDLGMTVASTPGERPRGIRGVGGLLLGFTGLALIFRLDIGDTSKLLLGGVLVTAAALCYAIGSILIHRKLSFAQPLGIATAAMLVASTALIVPGALSLPTRPPSAASILALVALGTIFTACTLVLFYGLIARAGPARATLAFYLSPAVTVILGAVLLQETVTWSTVLGLVATIVGSALTANQKMTSTELQRFSMISLLARRHRSTLDLPGAGYCSSAGEGRRCRCPVPVLDVQGRPVPSILPQHSTGLANLDLARTGAIHVNCPIKMFDNLQYAGPFDMHQMGKLNEPDGAHSLPVGGGPRVMVLPVPYSVRCER